MLAISPDYSWAYFNLGSIAYKSGNIEEAKEYLNKTIECNSNDIEAFKLLTKICLSEGNAEEILEILHTRLEKDANGDLYYCLARVYKFVGEAEEYYNALKSALANPYTLTFPKNVVKKEFQAIEEKLGHNEEIEPETEIPQYEESVEETGEQSVDEEVEEDETSEPDEEFEEDSDEDDEDDNYSELEDAEASDEDEEEYSEYDEEEDEDDEEYSDDTDEDSDETGDDEE